jgi:hypothetical protein
MWDELFGFSNIRVGLLGNDTLMCVETCKAGMKEDVTDKTLGTLQMTLSVFCGVPD